MCSDIGHLYWIVLKERFSNVRLNKLRQNPHLRPFLAGEGGGLGQAGVLAEPHFSVWCPGDPDSCTLFCGFTSEVIRAAVPPCPPLPPARPPPCLPSSERGSGSLHLAQRFSNLISSRRAKGWRPRPDLPGNGVCVKRFLQRGGTCSPALPPTRLHQGHHTSPGAPPVAVWWKGSLSCPQVNRHLKGAAVGFGRGHLGWGGSLFEMSPGSFLSWRSSQSSSLTEMQLFQSWTRSNAGERVHARLTSGLQMGQNCHRPSPSCVERRFPVKLNMDRWGTAPVSDCFKTLSVSRATESRVQNLNTSLDWTPAGTWIRRRSSSSSRGAIFVADRDVHKHMHTCTGNHKHTVDPTHSSDVKTVKWD